MVFEQIYWQILRAYQQFPLDYPITMVALQRANPLDRDESIALAMDEERYKGDASVMQPESGRQRELLRAYALKIWQ